LRPFESAFFLLGSKVATVRGGQRGRRILLLGVKLRQFESTYSAVGSEVATD
jgi:hypothetical protein